VGNDAANLAISNPEPVLLSGADFIDNTGDATNQYTQAELTLYFANEAGNRLVMENRSVVYSSSMSLERVVLNQLIEGPAAEGNLPTLPSAVKVQGVSLRDGVCYVDFDSIFLNEPMNVTDAIEIYSVVNSLTEITGVSQVQITINGSANEIFRNSIPLSGRFERDESYMEQPEAENEQP
jgi:germination protein M